MQPGLAYVHIDIFLESKFEIFNTTYIANLSVLDDSNLKFALNV